MSSSRLSISYSVKRDADLWTRLKSGDRKALDDIYVNHIESLIRYGNQFTIDSALVDDCIQDLFLDIWIKRNTLGDVTSIRFYLLKSLKRRIFRADKSSDSFVDAYDLLANVNLNVNTEDHQSETIIKLKSSLNQLSSTQREIVFLKYYNDLSMDEIAEILQLSKKQLYNALAKAMSKLRDAILFVACLLLMF